MACSVGRFGDGGAAAAACVAACVVSLSRIGHHIYNSSLNHFFFSSFWLHRVSVFMSQSMSVSAQSPTDAGRMKKKNN